MWNQFQCHSHHTLLFTVHTLIISFCSKFVSFPGEGLAVPNLTHFDVSFCEKLEALPHDMNTLLLNLQSLEIEGCPEICRLPEGGLPPNLKRLRVGGCEKQLRGLSSMGNLEAISHLEISGVDCESFKSYPDVGLLPHLPKVMKDIANVIRRSSCGHAIRQQFSFYQLYLLSGTLSDRLNENKAYGNSNNSVHTSKEHHTIKKGTQSMKLNYLNLEGAIALHLHHYFAMTHNQLNMMMIT
ncbi:hypothetical protein Ahy_B02g057312 isoform B [Arachis hypogaea]|uniref:Disease resistance protein n=1 Tax=Arachis hypogaea TaxID=3818 RepID=A0A445ABI1_ARAHY|nr:hypothetical protein Ahy_B02g057312 isoform B [Arachis hypogaea]